MKLVIKRFGQLTAKELYQILSLRAETFIVDQQIMYNDLDNVDQVSTHVFYQDTDSVAAYLRIIDSGQSYNSLLLGAYASVTKVLVLAQSCCTIPLITWHKKVVLPRC